VLFRSGQPDPILLSATCSDKEVHPLESVYLASNPFDFGLDVSLSRSGSLTSLPSYREIQEREGFTFFSDDYSFM